MEAKMIITPPPLFGADNGDWSESRIRRPMCKLWQGDSGERLWRTHSPVQCQSSSITKTTLLGLSEIGCTTRKNTRPTSIFCSILSSLLLGPNGVKLKSLYPKPSDILSCSGRDLGTDIAPRYAQKAYLPMQFAQRYLQEMLRLYSHWPMIFIVCSLQGT